MPNYTAEFAFELQDAYVEEGAEKYGRGVIPLVIERDPETVDEFKEIAREISRHIEGSEKIVVERLYVTPSDSGLQEAVAESYFSEPVMSMDDALEGEFVLEDPTDDK